MNLDAGTSVDRYVVESMLGKGGMATVYKVRHATLGSAHALKVLDIPAPAIRKRLMDEGRIQSNLRHPNIVAVTDVVTVGSVDALVLEFVHGPTLAELIAGRPLTLAQVDRLAYGILRGVMAAHQHGLIHRDLKPQNILLAVGDDELVPKITDFGLARIVADEGGDRRTRTGAAMGTPAYMSPEQIQDSKTVDVRADVFALGCILYELATGKQAFRGEHVVEIFNAVCEGTYVPPRELRPDLPDRMVRAIVGALQPDLEKRIATVKALFETWTDGQVLLVSHDSWDTETLQHARTLGASVAPIDLGAAPTFAASLTPPAAATLPEASPTDAPLPWREGLKWGIGAGLASIPFGYGISNALYAELMELPPRFVVALALGYAFPTGILAFLAVCLKAGRARIIGYWLWLPAVVVMFGSVLTALGNRNVLLKLPHFDLWERAQVAAQGLSEALTFEMIALDAASTVLGTTAVCAAWMYRNRFAPPPVPGVSPRGWTALSTAFALGLVLWVLHEKRIPEGGPMPFLVFVGLTAAAACSAATAHPAPDGTASAAKLLVAVTSVLCTLATAKCVVVLDSLWIHGELARATMADRFAALESHHESFGGENLDLVVGWAAAAFVTALIPLVGEGQLVLERMRWSRQAAFALPPLLGVAVCGLWARLESRATHSLIVPSYYAEASDYYFGLSLTDAELLAHVADGGGELMGWEHVAHDHAESGVFVVDAPRADAPRAGTIRKGDRIVSVRGLPVDDLQDLLASVRACLCTGATEGAVCALPGGCFEPGSSKAEVGVLRDGKLESATIPVRLARTAGF